MFERIFNGICEFFDDLLPDEFCLPCFLKGVAEGLLIGLGALILIASAPAWLAVALTIGLVAFGIYGAVQLVESWPSMSDAQKSEALGNVLGGLIAGRVGPTVPPMRLPAPGVRWLSTPEGVAVPVLVVEEATVVVGTGATSASAAAGSTLMASSGEGGGAGDDSDAEKSKKSKAELREEEKNARIDEYLESKGRKAEPNPLEGVEGAGRQGDRFVDGVKTEYKTLDPGASPNTVKNVVNNSIRKGGQARNIIIDARGSGLGQEEAAHGISKAMVFRGDELIR
ncbi:hypothetical protein [Cystobacter fuscus]|nr:hypothetical protein [Cystobacter fuscus]